MARCVHLRRLAAPVLGLALGLAAAATRAEAATSTTNMTVTATVLSSCALTTASLSFGQYVSGQTTNLDAEGTIAYSNCSGTLKFELNGGQANDINNRAMRSGANSLRYQIFRNPTRTNVFGQGSNAQEQNQITPGNGQLVVYGRIASGQAVPAGTYTDTVSVLLTF